MRKETARRRRPLIAALGVMRTVAIAFLAMVILTVWYQRTERTFLPMSKSFLGSEKKLLFLPYDQYGVYLLVEIDHDSDDWDNGYDRMKEKHREDPFRFYYRVSDLFGNVKSSYGGSTANWIVGGSTATTSRGEYPGARILFPRYALHPTFPGMFAMPVFIEASMSHAAGFDRDRIHLMVAGQRDDGYGFYILYLYLVTGVLGLVFSVALVARVISRKLSGGKDDA